MKDLCYTISGVIINLKELGYKYSQDEGEVVEDGHERHNSAY